MHLVSKQELSQADVLTAISDARGNLTRAAAKLGVRCADLVAHLDEHPDQSEQVEFIIDQCRQEMDDCALWEFQQAVLRGEGWAVKLYVQMMERDKHGKG